MAAIAITIHLLAPLELQDLSLTPVLPAATLKGRLRAECTLIAAALGLRTCGGPNRARMCHADPCPICQLFGGPWQPGALYFEDMRADKPAALEKRVRMVRSRQRGVVPGVGGGVSGLGSFERQYDLLPAGATVRGAIRYDFTPLWPLALTVAGLRAIDRIGGGRAVGHGSCRVEAAPLDRSGQPVADMALAAALREYVAEQTGSGKPATGQTP